METYGIHLSLGSLHVLLKLIGMLLFDQGLEIAFTNFRIAFAYC